MRSGELRSDQKESKAGHASRSFGFEALLFLVTFLWGTTFVAQRVAMDKMPPYAYVFARFFVSALILLLVALIVAFIRKKRSQETMKNWLIAGDVRQTIHGGLITGAALFAASAAQQMGLVTTTVGEASFINTFYIILVPIAGLFFGQKPKKSLWIAVVVALIGLYLISVDEGFHMSKGNAYVLLGAVLFAVEILAIDRYSKNADLLWYAVIEFFVVSILALCFSLFFESATWEQYKEATIPILYAGIVSGAFCYTMQNVCQKHLNPTLASLIMGTEAVFATLSGFVILNEMLNARKLIGCAFALLSVVIAELGKEKSTKTE